MVHISAGNNSIYSKLKGKEKARNMINTKLWKTDACYITAAP
jgi:hypothetical protein